MKVIKLFVTGVSPLLMHSPRGMMPVEGGVKKKKEIPSPKEEAELGAYRNDKEGLCFPQAAFRSSLIKAMTVTQAKVGKDRLSGVMKGSIFVIDEMTDIVDPKTKKPIKDYVIDIRRAVLPSGAGVMRARPRIMSWGCEISYEYDPDMVKPDWIVDGLNTAGKRVGVGDYRPLCPKGIGGPFGRYTVKLISS